MKQAQGRLGTTGYGIGLAIGLTLAAGLVSPALAQGDAAAGKKFYEATCLGCHGDGNTAPTTGPKLAGLIGRKAGTSAGGVISRANTESPIVWSEKTLDQYLASPSAAIHGTIMPIGVDNPKERANLIAYLKIMK
jgi:cytochrome c2